MIPAITDELIDDLVQTAGMMRSGHAYYLQGRVNELEIGAELSMFFAAVRGSGRNRYLTTVVFPNGAGQSLEDSECSCPVGFGCKHVAAVPGSVATTCAPSQTTGPYGADRVVQASFDADSRVLSTSDSVGVLGTVTYSANGNKLTDLDGQNNLTSYAYDGFDRLSQTNFPVATQGGNASDPNNYELLTYDAGSRVTNRRLRSGVNIVFTFDNLNRLRTLDHTDNNSTVTYSYDLVNNPTQLSRSNGGVNTNSYDALGRLVTEGQQFGSTSYLYDAAGDRTRITWGDGFYAGYAYDMIGGVTSINENGATSGVGVLATYSYDNLGRRTAVAYGNGTSRAYGYDAIGRLAGIQMTFPNSSGYNELIGGVGGSGTPISYTPSSQIASITRSNDAYAWTGGYNVSRAYTTNGLNQFTNSGGTTLGYDAQGNLNLSGTTTYGYDALNRLCCLASGELISHDPANRISQFYWSPSNVTELYYAGPALVAEWTTGPITNRYVPGPGTDEPIVWYQGSDTSSRNFLQADERGSIIAVSNTGGTVTNVNTYDEFGIPAATNVGRYQYTGQTWSPDVGMYWYKARWYSPTLGRFMQTDPIGYGDGLNMYNYVGSDPVNKNDPTGLVGAPDEFEIVVTGTKYIQPALVGSGGGGWFGWWSTSTQYGGSVGASVGQRTCRNADECGKQANKAKKKPLNNSPQPDCFGAALYKNTLSLALDTGGVALSIVAPEAKLTQLAIASVGLIASGVSGDLPAIGNGISGYHAIALDGQLLSKTGNFLVKGLGAFTGVAGVVNDLRNISNETSACRKAGGQ